MNNVQNTSPIAETLDKNIDMLKKIFNNNQSVVYKQFESAAEDSVRFCIIYIKHLCDSKKIIEDLEFFLLSLRFT